MFLQFFPLTDLAFPFARKICLLQLEERLKDLRSYREKPLLQMQRVPQV